MCCRKALAVVAVVLFAGGGLAYNHSNRQRQKPIHHPLAHAADTDDGEEVARAAAKGRSSGVLQKGKQKRGGLKSVKVVSAILLAHMGKRGMENLLSLAAIAVRGRPLLLSDNTCLLKLLNVLMNFARFWCQVSDGLLQHKFSSFVICMLVVHFDFFFVCVFLSGCPIHSFSVILSPQFQGWTLEYIIVLVIRFVSP